MNASSALVLEILERRAVEDRILSLHLEVAMWQAIATELQAKEENDEGEDGG